MDWQDDGIILSARRHGESGVIAVLLTETHGRHAGMVRGSTSASKRGILQTGNLVRAEWRGRLAEHLGSFTLDPIGATAAQVMDSPLKLAGLSAAAAVAEQSLPEREPHQRVYDGFAALINMLGMDELGIAWVAAYVRWELGLLADLGFGLELESCAATGAVGGLIYVSPRSGRAVSRAAGAPYHDKLLWLPKFLGGADYPGDEADDGVDEDIKLKRDLAAGLALTGYFLETHVFAVHNQTAPPARARFVERFNRSDTIYGGV
jgi:DNA repair protein RecO (recombination protein O)